MEQLECPYCTGIAEFVSSKEFYGKDYGTNLYVCYQCDAYVGTHGKGKRPLGTLANKELRSLRMNCHQLLDALWRGKNKKMGRSGAYRLLARLMNLEQQAAHIGYFNKEQCLEFISKIKEYRCLK